MDRFKECLKFVLKWEGGYSPPRVGDPNPTNYGVTQSVYDAYRERKKQPLRSVRFITMDEVEEIYREFYWLRSKSDKLPVPLDLVHFDTSVNMGVGTAGKLLQRSLNNHLPPKEQVKVDGIVGNETLSAIKKVPLKDLISTYINLRKSTYLRIANTNPTKRRFLKGWLNRLNDLERQVSSALKQPQPTPSL